MSVGSVSRKFGTAKACFPVPTAYAAAFYCVFAVFSAVTVVLPGVATAQDVFAIRGIEVDESADSDAKAKTQGVAFAKRAAFDGLMARLLVPEDLSKVPAISADRLEFLIRDVAIVSEKFGGGRYLAKMDVRFQTDGIREFLRRGRLAYAETASQPMVVLPIARAPHGDVLFEDTNPWLDAWARTPSRDGLVAIVPPLGDLSDMASIDAARATGGDIPALTAIARRYGVGAVLVAVLTLKLSPENIERAEVALTAYGPGWDGRSFSGNYLDNDPPVAAEGEESNTPLDPSERRKHFLERTASQVGDALEMAWKRENLLRFDLGNQTIEISAPISALGDWLAVERGLRAAAPVSAVRLVSLSLEEARAEVTFVGEPDRLAVALAQRGLSIAHAEEGDVFYTVTRAR